MNDESIVRPEFSEIARATSSLLDAARDHFSSEGINIPSRPEEVEIEAEIIKSEVAERFSSEIGRWIESGWGSGNRDRVFSLDDRNAITTSFAEAIEKISLVTSGAQGTLFDLDDEERHRFYGQLFTEYGYIVDRLTTKEGRVPFRSVQTVFLVHGSGIFSELAEQFPGLPATELAKGLKQKPLKPVPVLEQLAEEYQARIQETERQEREKAAKNNLRGENLLRQLRDKQNTRPFFLLQEIETINQWIAENEDKFAAVVADMTDSVAQSSESYHDNFGFEQGTREQRMLIRRGEELRDLRVSATVVEPDTSVDYVTLGKVVVFRDEESGKESKVLLGGYMTSEEGDVSYRAPLGHFLLGANEGETLQGRIGSKDRKLTILSVEDS